MKRKKRKNTSRKDFPMSIDLRDFIMYSNPARFAPKLRKNGGAAPTMNEFFNYGMPTPQTPFVFQDGGGMNEIQQMNQMIQNHYGSPFMDQRPSRGQQYLQKIKQLSYNTVSNNLMNEFQPDEEMMMQAFQMGGNNFAFTTPDFSNASQWYDAANKDNEATDRAADFATFGVLAGTEEPSYYNKIKSNEQTFDQPMAQDGMPLKYGVRSIDVHKTRRWARPENKLKSYTVNYDIYGNQDNIPDPQVNNTTNPSVTPNATDASGNTTVDASGKPVDQTSNTQQGNNNVKGNFLANLFARRGNYREPQGDATDANLPPQQQVKPGQSQFDPRGYNSAYSDFRNQVFQNRRRRTGEKLDELYDRENKLSSLYGQKLSQDDYDRISRLTNRYNRIGEGRTPDMVSYPNINKYANEYFKLGTSPEWNPPPAPRDYNFGTDYTAPQFGYGGYLKHYQDTGQVNDPFSFEVFDPGASEVDTGEDFGNSSGLNYKQASTAQTYGKVGQGSMTVKNKRKPKEFGMDAFYAGLNFLATPKQEKGAARDRFSAANVYTENTQEDKGDYDPLYGDFRPNQDVPVQNAGYNFQSMYAKMGGSYRFAEGGSSVDEDCPPNHYWDRDLQQCVPFPKGVIPVENTYYDPQLQDYLKKLNYKRNVNQYREFRRDKIDDFQNKNYKGPLNKYGYPDHESPEYKEFENSNEFKEYKKSLPHPDNPNVDFQFPQDFEERDYYPQGSPWDEESVRMYMDFFNTTPEQWQIQREELKHREDLWNKYKNTPPANMEELMRFYEEEVPQYEKIDFGKPGKIPTQKLMENRYNDWCPCSKQKEVIVNGEPVVQTVCVPCEETKQAKYGGLNRFMKGGSKAKKSSYKKGGEYYLSPEEIERIISMGGEVEFLD